ESNERAGLLTSTNNKIRIIGIDLMLLNHIKRIIKRNIEKTDWYLLILKQRLECFREGNTLTLDHGRKSIANFPMERKRRDKLGSSCKTNKLRFGWFIENNCKNDRCINNQEHIIPYTRTIVQVV